MKSFGFEGGWVDDIRAYKLLDGGARLLYLTNYGACLFDTHRREIVATTDLRDLAYEWSGFAMSPKVKLLVVGCSKRGSRDPVDGEHRYRNFARIYNLETGLALGENLLPGDQQTRWLADFSQDGRMVRLSSDSRSFAFDLAARVPSSEAPIEYGN